jgi:hypothetical protein
MRNDCECRDGCQCEVVAVPAAYSVTRGGKTMKVCTRCTLPGDEDQKCIAHDEDAAMFFDYDPLGAFVLSYDMATK